MWANFEEETQEAVFHAQELAMRHGNGTVEPEHLLLAFPEAPSSRAMKMLVAAGVLPEAIRGSLIPAIPSSEARSKDLAFSPKAKLVIDYASIVARGRNSSLIGTDHLLLAIVKEKTSPAAQFLIESGANLTRLQEVA